MGTVPGAPPRALELGHGPMPDSILRAMPQSLAYLLTHIVFSTKDRAPWIEDSVRPALQTYLATFARNADCQCFRVGGVADHVHIAVRLSPAITMEDLIEELKTSSSKWIKTQSPALDSFAWQRGYGAFSVGARELNALLVYIDEQEEHHRIRTCQDEYRAVLMRHGIEYDERYAWD